MSKCLLVKLLKNEIQSLNHLVESLEDESKLCFPNEYNCTGRFRGVIFNLRRIEKEARKSFDYQNVREVFGVLTIGG